MNIQWYPGHMAKASREIAEAVKAVDVLLVVGDARAVKRSVSGDFIKQFSSKKIIYVFNKTDMADEAVVASWKNRFSDEDAADRWFVDCISKTGIAPLKKELSLVRERFRFPREVRAMAVGIPNVGKSMLLNQLAGRSSLKTENRPAVTRAVKWIKAAGGFYLCDTPGVLTPKFTDPFDGFVLASLGSVREEVVDINEVSLSILSFLINNYPELLRERYGLNTPSFETDANEETGEEQLETAMFEAVAKKRGFLQKGGLIDEERTARHIFEEFKNGKIGRIAFDKPDAQETAAK